MCISLALYAGPLQEEAYILKNNFLTFNHYDVAYLSGKTDFDSYIKDTKFMVSLVYNWDRNEKYVFIMFTTVKTQICSSI